MSRRYNNWINGTWKKTASETSVERYSPANGQLVASFANSNEQDIKLAVNAARATFEARTWADLPGSEKSSILNKWAELIEQSVDLLAKIEAEESGKPIRFARGEVAWAAQMTRFAASLAWTLKGDAFTNLGNDKLGLVTREPRGVVGMIVPWNFPLVCLFQKLPFALAAGCTTVIKPSELTSGTALEVALLAEKAGVPAGVINVVTGAGKTVGEALITHPEVDMLSFTGSTAVGKHIARQASDRVGRVALELGGKAANLVFADADIEAALDGVLFGAILNQGEECAAGTRLIIEESIATEFLTKLTERAQRVIVGSPLDETVDVGALIHEQHMNQVLRYIESGKEEGARLLVGGERLKGGAYENGFFVAPTIFSEVTSDMKIFREEIFGPVLCATSFKTIDEAVALVNDTNYGLANGLWTKDIDKAHQVSRRLKSGTVYVNTFLETAMQMPFGGFKQSGIGRELGLEALHEYTEVKSTFIKLGNRIPALPHTI